MKKMIYVGIAFIVIIIVAVVLCAPLMENYEPEVRYSNGGYANTKGIMQGLSIGDIAESYGVVYRAKANPELADKLEAYLPLVEGRNYKHIAAADYTLEGDYPNPPYTETSYMEIIMEDGSMMYAIVVFLQEEDGCGVTDFDLYTECPW